MKKLVLFSCFNPDIGGGGVIFRSLISGLEGWEVTWAYLGHGPCRYNGCQTVCLGTPFMGGAFIQDIIRTPLLWADITKKPVQKLARQLVDLQPNAFWVLGMHEGLLIIPELKRISNIPIHVSVHDDQELGIFARSKRYGWMASLSRGRVAKALRAANSIDVISSGMRKLYKSKYGLESKVVHLFIRGEILKARSLVEIDQTAILIGHIGTLYDEDVGMHFGEGLRYLAALTKRRVRWKFIGLSPTFQRLRDAFFDIIEDLGNLDESDAIKVLAECDISYAMYPFRENARVFRMTSFPTKMSTYLQSGRPIFAHTPEDSSIADFVSRFELGKICPFLDEKNIAMDLESLLRGEIEKAKFETAAAEVFGFKNIQTIQNCLDVLVRKDP